jgi:hypothetical protein
MRDINTLLNALVKDGGEITSTPYVTEQLNKQAVTIDAPAQPSLDESLEHLFRERKKRSIEIAEKLPSPPAISPAAIVYLYIEIRACIIFGLNGAAITLSAILVEFMLKFASYKVEMVGSAEYDAEKWLDLEKLDFSKSISRARRNQLLTKKQRNLLHEFRERYGNPYNHLNIKNVTELVVAEDITRGNLETPEVERIDVEAKNVPMIQAHAKSLIDAQETLSVFEFADKVVKLLFSKPSHPSTGQRTFSDKAQA